MIRTHIYPEPPEKKGKEIMGSTFSWTPVCPYLSYCSQFWQFEGKSMAVEAYYMIGNKWIWIWENEREEVKS